MPRKKRSKSEDLPPCTIVKFRIVPPLYELHDQTIAVPLKAGDMLGNALCHFTIVGSGLPTFYGTSVNAKVTIPGDEIGVLHNTIVEVALPGILEMLHSPQVGFVPPGQRFAVQVLNSVIGHYRMQVPAPQIRPIAVKHARGYEFEHHMGNGKGTTGQFMGGNALSPKGEPADVPQPKPETVEAIQAAVYAGPVPLWASLNMDALADLASGNALSGLAHLYISFEMLAHQVCRSLGAAAIGRAEIDAYLMPPKGEPPNIDQVIASCRSYGNIPMRSAGRLTRQLWKHRNEVLHGRPVKLSREAVDSAVDSYRRLTDWLLTTKPKA